MIERQQKLVESTQSPIFQKVDASVVEGQSIELEMMRNHQLQVLKEMLNEIPAKFSEFEDKMCDIASKSETALGDMKELQREGNFREQRFHAFLKKKDNKFFTILLAGLILTGISFGLIWDFMQRKSDQARRTNLELMQRLQSTKVNEAAARKLFATTSFVNLRLGPSLTDGIIKTLNPNSLVELVEQRGGWLKVDAKNYATGDSKIGWAFFENLKPIQKN